MKRLFNMLLALVVVCAVFAGCVDSGKTDAEKIIGKWEFKINLGDAMNALALTEESGLQDMFSYFDFDGIDIVGTYEFKEDGTVTVEADASAIVDGMKKAFEDGMPNYLRDMLEALLVETAPEMSLDDYLDALGMSLDDLVTASLAEMDFSSMTDEIEDSFASEGTYLVQDGKIYAFDGDEHEIDETTEYYEYEFSGTNTLKFTAVGGGDSDDAALFEQLLPLILKKK